MSIDFPFSRGGDPLVGELLAQLVSRLVVSFTGRGPESTEPPLMGRQV